jgi:hypothetical protein
MLSSLPKLERLGRGLAEAKLAATSVARAVAGRTREAADGRMTLRHQALGQWWGRPVPTERPPPTPSPRSALPCAPGSTLPPPRKKRHEGPSQKGNPR